MNVVGICGSLRLKSFNRGLLRAAVDLAPPGMNLEICEHVRALPLFDMDLEAAGPPEPVRHLIDVIRAADAVLIATPEYNYSLPAALKNAIEWVSRPPQTSPWRKKRIAIMGASGGMSGTMRAQLALRQVGAGVGADLMVRPEFHLPHCVSKFDLDSNLTDEPTRKSLAEFLAAFAAWAAR